MKALVAICVLALSACAEHTYKEPQLDEPSRPFMSFAGDIGTVHDIDVQGEPINSKFSGAVAWERVRLQVPHNTVGQAMVSFTVYGTLDGLALDVGETYQISNTSLSTDEFYVAAIGCASNRSGEWEFDGEASNIVLTRDTENSYQFMLEFATSDGPTMVEGFFSL